MIIGDYHTHTYFSHGKGSILKNVAEASKKGLKEVAITDHGLRHVAFGMRSNDIFKMRKLVDEAQLQYPDTKVYLGAEANIYCSEGKIDMKPREHECFDLVIAGYHKLVWSKNPADFFKFFGRSYVRDIFGPTKSSIDFFTNVFIKTIKSGLVDAITHLNYGIVTDVKRVAQAAYDYGVMIELNGKRISMTDEEILEVQNTGATFLINSDAHSADRVGDFCLPLEVVNRLNLKKQQIANWDKLPSFKKIKR